MTACYLKKKPGKWDVYLINIKAGLQIHPPLLVCSCFFFSNSMRSRPRREEDGEQPGTGIDPDPRGD